jgi:GNAT superfamily N-acetyltransferase
MKTAAMSISQVKKQLRKAIGALTFSHAQAPGTETAESYASAILDSGKEVVIDIIRPGDTQLSPAELVTLFNQDQLRKSRAFSHPRIEGEDEALFGLLGEVPLHAQDLVFNPEMFLPSGIEKDKASAQYCLIARKRGAIVGMVSFRVSLTTYEDAGVGRPTGDDVCKFDFDIGLDLVYVCARHRSKGYGKALTAAIADVFRVEVLHISKQLAGAASATGKRFEMQPYVHSEWVSQSGKLAHLCLMDELDLAIDEHNELYVEEEPARQFLDVHHSEQDACY